MIIPGIALILFGLLLKTPELVAIGAVLTAVGAVLGAVGGTTAPRFRGRSFRSYPL
jgi:hypothetical protein